MLFFFLCIAIGVGSVVALRSLIQNLSQAVGGDARALLTADFEVSSTNDFSPTDIQKIESVINNSNIVEARNEAITTSQMARPVDAANVGRVIALRAGIPREKIAHTVSRNCASGFECVTQAVDRVTSGPPPQSFIYLSAATLEGLETRAVTRQPAKRHAVRRPNHKAVRPRKNRSA